MAHSSSSQLTQNTQQQQFEELVKLILNNRIVFKEFDHHAIIHPEYCWSALGRFVADWKYSLEIKHPGMDLTFLLETLTRFDCLSEDEMANKHDIISYQLGVIFKMPKQSSMLSHYEGLMTYFPKEIASIPDVIGIKFICDQSDLAEIRLQPFLNKHNKKKETQQAGQMHESSVSHAQRLQPYPKLSLLTTMLQQQVEQMSAPQQHVAENEAGLISSLSPAVVPPQIYEMFHKKPLDYFIQNIHQGSFLLFSFGSDCQEIYPQYCHSRLGKFLTDWALNAFSYEIITEFPEQLLNDLTRYDPLGDENQHDIICYQLHVLSNLFCSDWQIKYPSLEIYVEELKGELVHMAFAIRCEHSDAQRRLDAKLSQSTTVNQSFSSSSSSFFYLPPSSSTPPGDAPKLV